MIGPSFKPHQCLLTMYVEEKGSAVMLVAMLAANRSAGVTPEVNLRKCIKHMPPPRVNKGAHSVFETQRRCPPKI